MAEKGQIYKCEVCGNVVSVFEAGSGDLVCCGQMMKLQVAKTAAEEGKEKHVPVVEINGNNVKVKVGSIPHPMEDKHYISIIQVLKDGKVVFCKKLMPGQEPEAEFQMDDTENLTAREYCNLHGLWTS
ncbi:MAG: desulfoferrodoxin [Candidatus Woesearchaeota archaeon]